MFHSVYPYDESVVYTYFIAHNIQLKQKKFLKREQFMAVTLSISHLHRLTTVFARQFPSKMFLSTIIKYYNKTHKEKE